MTNNNIQFIECVTIANEDYLQSLLAVGFYALALKAELHPLVNHLDFSNTQTKILPYVIRPALGEVVQWRDVFDPEVAADE